ncbi:glutamine--fructose-6-phosphate transaminase (isomerizing) [Lentisphaera profundi]|uniref:Glutamine--fructose-6-phosphate aminotransferase [isomerizing] n=1 Tax=Lentisphaera profundi TaxID=1658616 RepID=A0ABY7VNW5_9BACT|nr:glutamine--fructose-6-phosphate transaminase (isomerizing) [Lentisphaera profundi]WDE95362.1 glutamine--fructose-6-phosphate transaminase (isomerizing) [Lentisphaera profundi]
MCGIIAYAGENNPLKILVNGLERLEYRGYDSAGVSVLKDNQIYTVKAAGKVSSLAEKIDSDDQLSDTSLLNCGIAHTRWATHGGPTENNAHPHLGQNSRIALVHNGIIENYQDLKNELLEQGHTFKSETDTEILAHLIEAHYTDDLKKAVSEALAKVEGAYGIAVISKDEPDTIITARFGSPIVIGLCKDEVIIASDINAIVHHTDRVVYLNDGDLAIVNKDGISFHDLSLKSVQRNEEKITHSAEEAQKGGYSTFMMKEIHDQPRAVRNSVRGHLDFDNATTSLGGLHMNPKELASIDRIQLFACGTSLNAALLGQYFFEDLAGIPCQVTQAADFRYRNPIIEKNTLAIALSQSGETADTLAAVHEAKRKGADLIAICNAVGSTIAREAGRGVYLHAGPEISVASTKAFTTQVSVLLQLAILLGRTKRLDRSQSIEILEAIDKLPEQIEEVLKLSDSIREIAKKYTDVHSMFFIGRGYQYPVALEGALKVKEISYIHAEGYHAAELKHGPLALLDEKVPVVAICTNKDSAQKIVSNIRECSSRSAPVIAVVSEGIETPADDSIVIPATHPTTAPILSAVALQLFSFHIADLRGCPIDQPRNLAKSVTVE